MTESLGRRYGDAWALRELDLAVPTGSVLGLLGHNGAGKTTAVRILTTLLRPTTGRAVVAGRDVATEAGAVRERIGLAGQEATVDGLLTARANLELVGRLHHLPARAARARADELLERLRLADVAGALVRTFSGGMRRRLDLAASLVAAPPVLFLDEPTTGLDPRSRADLWVLLQELVRDGATLLLTTQYLDEADHLADDVVVLQRPDRRAGLARGAQGAHRRRAPRGRAARARPARPRSGRARALRERRAGRRRRGEHGRRARGGRRAARRRRPRARRGRRRGDRRPPPPGHARRRLPDPDRTRRDLPEAA